MAKDDACESINKCRYCGEEFMGWVPQARYCCDEHKELARKKRSKEKRERNKK